MGLIDRIFRKRKKCESFTTEDMEPELDILQIYER